MIIGAGDGPADACTAIGPVYPSVRLVTPWPVHREPITADGPIMPGNLRLNTDAPPVSLHNGKPLRVFTLFPYARYRGGSQGLLIFRFVFEDVRQTIFACPARPFVFLFSRGVERKLLFPMIHGHVFHC